jgi:hypothetical protein
MIIYFPFGSSNIHLKGDIEKVKLVDRDNIQTSLNTLRYIQQTVVHNSERQ